MGSTKRQQNLCTICGTMVGVFSCHGCNKNFCLIHTSEHRDFLQKSMNEISNNCDLLKDSVQGHKGEQHQISIMEQIEQWEQQSIDKIRRLADDVRQQISTIIRDRTDNFKEKLGELQQQLEIARQDGGFYENDLTEWTRRFDELQRIVAQQQTIKIEEDIGSTSFISRISVNDISSISFRKNVPLKNHDQNDIEKKYDDYTDNHNQYSYSKGSHSIRFKIHEYEPNSSIIFGIVSKQKSINSSTCENPTFYGWTENNLVYFGGDSQPNYHGYKSDFQLGDIYELIIDCKRKKIQLRKERTDISYDLEVDTTKCPFPWQPNVRILNNLE
ncbi:unnamed protein product [Rotaria sordida]|uniref:B box-type domain-containing protein n=1 Tax=Rotaria sordida TaxID=392033 RepID=A0A814DAH3_9BILA|nr:unnamed protein product [Rotaria sordida]CAF0860619.1 unnamed protein product [Rotaria sordida]CAF0865657.1 unnamed protein product [Rotaria sordida]CAF0882206.1 unnamed protein product [Rotaria sordida]CAF0953183.1 unnamed protein product [Rotaria sordida]